MRRYEVGDCDSCVYNCDPAGSIDECMGCKMASGKKPYCKCSLEAPYDHCEYYTPIEGDEYDNPYDFANTDYKSKDNEL